MNYIRIIWRLKTPVSTRILRLAKIWWKSFKNILSETDLVPLQHLRWSYLWQLTALVNGNWNHCLAIVRKSPILYNAWILDLRLPIKKSIFDKIRIRGSHLDLQKHPLMVVSWRCIHKDFISKKLLNSDSKIFNKYIRKNLFFNLYVWLHRDQRQPSRLYRKSFNSSCKCNLS